MTLGIVPDWHSTMIHSIKRLNDLKQTCFFRQNVGGGKKMSYNFENLQFSQIKQIC